MIDKNNYSDNEDEYEDEDEEYEEGGQSIRRVVRIVSTPIRYLLSKETRQTYIGAVLFLSTSLALLCIAAVAYWVFYLNYVPQIGLKRIVHLQFDNEKYPWGISALGSDLASLQQYDVSVSLKLPRTAANIATGNFMLDLVLESPPQTSIIGTNSSTSLIAHSRRPGILTYTSPLVDTANTLSRMPLYLLGWQREAETVEVPMFENLEFSRGWRNVPASLRLEIQSRELMQVYSVEVNFRAKFRGLRWLMYRWRLLSFLAFTSIFWTVSMASSSIVWLLLSNYLGSETRENGPFKMERKARFDRPIKKESEDSSSVKVEDNATVKLEEIEETTNIPPLEAQPGNEAEGVASIRDIHEGNMSGWGTAFAGHDETLVAQRRQSHAPH